MMSTTRPWNDWAEGARSTPEGSHTGAASHSRGAGRRRGEARRSQGAAVHRTLVEGHRILEVASRIDPATTYIVLDLITFSLH